MRVLPLCTFMENLLMLSLVGFFTNLPQIGLEGLFAIGGVGSRPLPVS